MCVERAREKGRYRCRERVSEVGREINIKQDKQRMRARERERNRQCECECECVCEREGERNGYLFGLKFSRFDLTHKNVALRLKRNFRVRLSYIIYGHV